jgi:GNAT superfamily N-acetyltransferase
MNNEALAAPSRAQTAAPGAIAVRCAPMDAATRDAAEALLGSFLRADDHYLASSAAYGDGGADALARALDLFLARPEVGFVWLAFATAAQVPVPVGACVVCRAISTSRGSLVAKLDDVTVASGWQGRGVGAAMLAALAEHLRGQGITRIDTACHRANAGAWRFYERLGFLPLDEERIALLL